MQGTLVHFLLVLWHPVYIEGSYISDHPIYPSFEVITWMPARKGYAVYMYLRVAALVGTSLCLFQWSCWCVGGKVNKQLVDFNSKSWNHVPWLVFGTHGTGWCQSLLVRCLEAPTHWSGHVRSSFAVIQGPFNVSSQIVNYPPQSERLFLSIVL